ncbi:MAG: lytic transglycosylase F [Betaproteobacteria bacterium]|uniref:Lytic transglycosylase F n=1 Tax=Candidatus Proximibacter danicus TaxID=2954365 RepID=A0A9D7PRG0_9PROT|nr:lytic transglycosylase F [Candidatus Proximibacter danicus]
MQTYSLRLFLSLAAIALFAGALPSQAAETKAPAKAVLSLEAKVFKGDFEAMKKRRMVRIAVPYSRTLFFNDKGVQRGLTAENIQAFERWLNKKYKTGAHPITVYAIPVTRDRMLPAIIDGKADIAAGNLTITAERDARVDFSNPIDLNVDEVVVTGPVAPALSSLDDLAGKEVYVRPASSYHESLKRLNEKFRQAGKPQMVLRLMPDALEDEDLMDMANAGMIGIIVVDDWKADLWAGMLTGLKVHDTLKLNEGGRVGWAFRQNSPQLAAIVNEFLADQRKIMGSVTQRMAAFQKRQKGLKNATVEADWQRFEQSVALFKVYGERYQFDYLMMTAQGFQESGLNQNAKSHVGAIGIMQIMPATGKELGVGDITQAEANVHGGIKYMRKLLDTYFADADFDDTNRTLFAFAAYNAGPGRIARLRKEAEKEGLNPDKWFNNVELIAAKRVGQETVGYVRNIYKYYTAYKLQLETLEARRSALKETSPAPAAK